MRELDSCFVQLILIGLMKSGWPSEYQSQNEVTELTDPHSVKSQLKSGELTVKGDQWPIFLYADNRFDPEDPWKGLLRSRLLVTVSVSVALLYLADIYKLLLGLQARVHVTEFR
jgi:hypothetical protein